MTGVKTNIITSVNVTLEFDNDSPELKALVDTTAQNFKMEEISADKAYLSKENLNTLMIKVQCLLSHSKTILKVLVMG